MSGTLQEDLSVFRIFGKDVCSAAIQRTRCSASTETFSVFVTFLTAMCILQQYKGKVLLLHCNCGCEIAPQCYVIRRPHCLPWFSSV